ncbi:hypothetical protein [Pseudomonas sp.]|uniref:hypothetical protein n=1 Tax=Pseudomonas sp. TaxID=306 RepID=UPI003CC5DD5A
MSLNSIVKRLNELGCKAQAKGKNIDLEIGSAKLDVKIDGEWEKAINSYYKARQYSFDASKRILKSNSSAEFLTVRLDPGFFYRVSHTFKDQKETTITLSPASREYKLAYFESERYENSFERIINKMERRYANYTSGRATNTRIHFRFEDLFFNHHTITYKAKRKPKNKDIVDIAIEPVKACLFALAYRKHESWELSHEIKAKGLIYPRADDEEGGDLEIPRASYDDAAVTFYKVAKSSQFPSQVFLAYYHILEFHFLRVADESLFNAVCAQLNNPDFRSTYENITKLLAAIKRNDNTSSEKEMLHGVLRKYVAEEEFIEFISSLEDSIGDNIFTKNKKKIFGEKYTINLSKGNALNSAAQIIKHIRNALVHSSDKYSREDCFMPLSESEDDIVKFIPIVQFMAERVIFSTAKREL